MFKFVYRPGFSKELRMKSRKHLRASIVYMLNLFSSDKDSVGNKEYRISMLSSRTSALFSFVCYMLESIICCGLKELFTRSSLDRVCRNLGVLLGVILLFSPLFLFEMFDLPTCKNWQPLAVTCNLSFKLSFLVILRVSLTQKFTVVDKDKKFRNFQPFDSNDRVTWR